MRDISDLPGGTAFPVNIPGHGDGDSPGMSLRDWFAGLALQHSVCHRTFDERVVARIAYAMADEMLRARLEKAR